MGVNFRSKMVIKKKNMTNFHVWLTNLYEQHTQKDILYLISYDQNHFKC